MQGKSQGDIVINGRSVALLHPCALNQRSPAEGKGKGQPLLAQGNRPEGAATPSPGQSPWVTVVARLSPCKGKSFPRPYQKALLSITDGRASRFLIHFQIIAHRRAMALQRYEENPKYPYFSRRNLILVPHFVQPVPKTFPTFAT